MGVLLGAPRCSVLARRAAGSSGRRVAGRILPCLRWSASVGGKREFIGSVESIGLKDEKRYWSDEIYRIHRIDFASREKHVHCRDAEDAERFIKSNPLRSLRLCGERIFNPIDSMDSIVFSVRRVPCAVHPSSIPHAGRAGSPPAGAAGWGGRGRAARGPAAAPSVEGNARWRHRSCNSGPPPPPPPTPA